MIHISILISCRGQFHVVLIVDVTGLIVTEKIIIR